MLKPRSFLIKPASSACNLACTYCFYLDEASHRENACLGMMNDEVVDTFLKKAFDDVPAVSFAFQGGEPSLVGLPWFEHFVALVEKYNTKKIYVSYAFQTNATRIDDEWAKFFAEHKFLVGVSLDGFSRTHNLNRSLAVGGHSFNAVMKGIEALERNGAAFNILTVVTDTLAYNLDAVWDFYLSHGLLYQQYIACIDPIGKENVSLSPAVYGDFLIALAKKWIASLSSDHPVSIRLFDNFLSFLCGYPEEACDMHGYCSVQYVLESDGTVYPCDFYCTDGYALGNVVTDSLASIDAKRDAMHFITDSGNKSKACQECHYQFICHGGCKRYRLEDGQFRFCESYKTFFDAMLPTFTALAKQIMEHQQKVNPSSQGK